MEYKYIMSIKDINSDDDSFSINEEQPSRNLEISFESCLPQFLTDFLFKNPQYKNEDNLKNEMKIEDYL